MWWLVSSVHFVVKLKDVIVFPAMRLLDMFITAVCRLFLNNLLCYVLISFQVFNLTHKCACANLCLISPSEHSTKDPTTSKSNGKLLSLSLVVKGSVWGTGILIVARSTFRQSQSRSSPVWPYANKFGREVISRRLGPSLIFKWRAVRDCQKDTY